MENFQMWKFQIEILFQASNLHSHILNKTEQTQRTNEWLIKDAMVKRIMIVIVDNILLI